MAEGDLQQRLEKLGRAIVKDIEEWELATRGSRRKALEQLTKTVERKLERAFDKEERREARRRQKRERKLRKQEEHLARQRQNASIPGGIVFLSAAVICVIFALRNPGIWWMLFVALGLGSAGAHQLHLASERRRLERGSEADAPPEPVPDSAPSRHEVDVLCDQLLADLEQSPEAVRSFLKEPKKTVESLRQTCRALDGRRQQLFADAERLEPLQAQRAELLRKREVATDSGAQRKLEESIRSLEGQIETLTRLRQFAERVDGEYTSLLVLLQELRTRVSMARTAGSTIQLEGLRQSVQRLNSELDAITEALDAVQYEGLPAIEPVSEDAAGAPAKRTRERT